MAIDGTVSCGLAVRDQRAFGVSALADVGLNLRLALGLTDGTGAGQGNKIYQASRTLGGATESLDLAGVLADVAGNTLTFASLAAWAVVNDSITNTIAFGASGSNPWIGCLNAAGTITLRPSTATGQSFFLVTAADATGMAVTAGTGDLLLVTGTSGQSYRIVFIGR